jgi:hypothetical protein
LQLERVTVLTDAVILAAEQFQEIRLLELEKINIKADELLIIAIFTFILERNLVGKVLSKIALKILSSVMVSRAVLKSLLEMELVKAGQRFKRLNSSSLINETRSSFQGNALQVIEEYYDYSKTIFMMMNSSGEQYWADVAKGAKKKYNHFPQIPVLPATDSTLVSIIEVVQNYTSIQRFTILSELSVLEAQIRLEIFNIEDVNQLTKADLTVEETFLLNSILRDRYKRLFEAIMWAKGLGFDTKKPPEIDKSHPRKYGIAGVPGAILIYFLRRFIDPKTDKSFESEKDPDINKRNANVFALHRYFSELGQELMTIRETTKSKSDGMTVVPKSEEN